MFGIRFPRFSLSTRLRKLEQEVRLVSQATVQLAAAIAALTTSVNALIAANAGPREDTPAIQAQTDAVNALKVQVDAAVAPPPV